MVRKFGILYYGVALVSLTIFIFCLLVFPEKNLEKFLTLFPKKWLYPYIDSSTSFYILFDSLIATSFIITNLYLYFKRKHVEKNEYIYLSLSWILFSWILFLPLLKFVFNLKGILFFIIPLIPAFLGIISLNIYNSKKK